MDTTEAFVGLACRDCDETVDAAVGTHRCPECGGRLDPTYAYDDLAVTRDTFTERRFESMWRYAELLPFAPETAVTLPPRKGPIFRHSIA